jgi:hypothetical protein
MNNWHFKRSIFIISCLFLLEMLMLCISAQAQRLPRRNPPLQKQPQQSPAAPAVLNMRVEEGRVTADIVNSPMQTVLKELADWTGIQFEVRSQDNPLVSVHLQGVPVQEAIQRIASDDDTVFFYDQKRPGAEHITFVRVYPRTKPVQQPGIVYLGTGAVIRNLAASEDR